MLFHCFSDWPCADELHPEVYSEVHGTWLATETAMQADGSSFVLLCMNSRVWSLLSKGPTVAWVIVATVK